MSAPTICRDCDNVVSSTRSQRPTSWLCRMFPRRHTEGFVHPTWWIENEPFQRCQDLNRGSCPVFTPIRVAPEGGEHVD